MAKKVLTLIKLQIPGGQANPAPPVGPALGQHGVNIMEFCKAFNAQTAQHRKRYRQARSAVDRAHVYSPVEAVRLVKDAPASKFDETIEVHLNLGLNVRHADEQLRGTMMLPHGTGREQRVAVFAEGDKAREDRKSTRLNSSHRCISYAVFCLKKKK